MDVPDMSDDVVAVEEFLPADRAFVVSFSGVALHVASELGFGVEAVTANLQRRIIDKSGRTGSQGTYLAFFSTELLVTQEMHLEDAVGAERSSAGDARVVPSLHVHDLDVLLELDLERILTWLRTVPSVVCPAH